MGCSTLLRAFTLADDHLTREVELQLVLTMTFLNKKLLSGKKMKAERKKLGLKHFGYIFYLAQISAALYASPINLKAICPWQTTLMHSSPGSTTCLTKMHWKRTTRRDISRRQARLASTVCPAKLERSAYATATTKKSRAFHQASLLSMPCQVDSGKAANPTPSNRRLLMTESPIFRNVRK